MNPILVEASVNPTPNLQKLPTRITPDLGRHSLALPATTRAVMPFVLAL
jgi:hypothetical protein